MAGLGLVLDTRRTGPEARALEEGLRRLIVGQDEAIEQIVNVYQMYLAGLNSPDRPVGSFLFLGPTGSGKTRIVEATAEVLLGSPRAVIKIDCGEFQHSHEIAKLIGSPPGYLGHRETHPLLSQEVLNQYHTEKVKLSFVLFDEVEKASDALWNLLLGILDKATLTLGDNRRVDFSSTMVFLTSNLGAAEISSILKPRLGFSVPTGKGGEPASGENIQLREKIARAALEAARRRFTPEFMNRLDKIVVFRPLGEKELRQVLDIELRRFQERILQSPTGNYFLLEVSKAAQDYLLEQGTDSRYGARHLRRAIERLVVQPLSNLIATNQVRRGDVVLADLDASQGLLIFERTDEGLSLETVARRASIPLSFPGDLAALAAGEVAKGGNNRSNRKAI